MLCSIQVNFLFNCNKTVVNEIMDTKKNTRKSDTFKETASTSSTAKLEKFLVTSGRLTDEASSQPPQGLMDYFNDDESEDDIKRYEMLLDHPKSRTSSHSISSAIKKSRFDPINTIQKLDFTNLTTLGEKEDILFNDESKAKFQSEFSKGQFISKTSFKPTHKISDRTFGKTDESLNDELMDLSERIKEGLYSEIGYGFKSKGGLSKKKVQFASTEIPDDESTWNTNSLDKSITTLQNRIAEQRQKFHEINKKANTVKSGIPHSKFPNARTSESIAGSSRKSLVKQQKAQQSAKLAEISKIFAQSLKNKIRNPQDVISIPDTNETQPVKTKTELDPNRNNRSKVSSGKTRVIPGDVTNIEALATVEAAQGNPLEFNEYLKKQSPPMLSLNTISPREFVSPTKIALQKVHALEKKFNSSLQPAVTKQTLGMPERFASGCSLNSKISMDHINRRIDASVKTMEDASIVANRIGAALTRVTGIRGSAAATVGTSPDPNLQDNTYDEYNENIGFKDFSKAFGLQRTSMETVDNIKGTNWKLPKTSKQIELQTETKNSEKITQAKGKLTLPEITFVKDMSEADQKELIRLRQLKKQWDNYDPLQDYVDTY